MKANKKGISLIVLVVTIIVIIILAAAVIMNLNNNNPVKSANAAKYMSDRDNVQSAITMYISKLYSIKRSELVINKGDNLHMGPNYFSDGIGRLVVRFSVPSNYVIDNAAKQTGYEKFVTGLKAGDGYTNERPAGEIEDLEEGDENRYLNEGYVKKIAKFDSNDNQSIHFTMPKYNTNYNWSMTSAGNVVLGVRADGTTGLADVTDTYFGDAEGKVTHTYYDDDGTALDGTDAGTVGLTKVDSPEEYYIWLHGNSVGVPTTTYNTDSEAELFTALQAKTEAYTVNGFGHTY